jgi:hypothetical protein
MMCFTRLYSDLLRHLKPLSPASKTDHYHQLKWMANRNISLSESRIPDITATNTDMNIWSNGLATSNRPGNPTILSGKLPL